MMMMINSYGSGGGGGTGAGDGAGVVVGVSESAWGCPVVARKKRSTAIMEPSSPALSTASTDGAVVTRRKAPSRKKRGPASPRGRSRDDGSLLEYYQRRCEQFETEREEWLQRAEAFDGSLKGHAKLKSELARRHIEVEELQRALSDAHVFLYEEREEVLRLSAENDELKVREMEDRKRIQHLLAMTRPVEQEVTFFRDAPPAKVTRGHSLRAGCAGCKRLCKGKCKGRCKERKAAAFAQDALPDAHVVRTVILPNEQVGVMHSKIDSLQRQLKEYQKLHSDLKQAMLEDRHARERDHERLIADYKQRCNRLEEELCETTALNQMTTRDYLRLRHQVAVRERKQSEAMARVKRENDSLQTSASSATEQMKRKAMSAQKHASLQQRDMIEHLRTQTINREEDLAMMREQYAATQQFYKNRLAHLEDALETLRGKYKALHTQRNLEFTGYTADIQQLRSHVRNLEELLIHLKVEQLRSNGAFKDENQNRINRWELTDNLQFIKTEISRIATKMGYL